MNFIVYILFAQQYARGDPECFFYCGYEQMKQNANNLPGTYTLALALDIGLDWTKEVSQISDMENLVNTAMGEGKKSQPNIIELGLSELITELLILNLVKRVLPFLTHGLETEKHF